MNYLRWALQAHPEEKDTKDKESEKPFPDQRLEDHKITHFVGTENDLNQTSMELLCSSR